MKVVEVQRAGNGWVVETPEGKMVVEHQDGESEAAAGARLLYVLQDAFGLIGSRYAKERVRVVVEPGDKYLDD